MKKTTTKFLYCLLACCLTCLSCAGPTAEEEADAQVTPISANLAARIGKYARLCSGFYHGVSIVQNSQELYGLIDLEGNEVAPCKYSSLEYYKDGYFKAADREYKKKFGLVDSLGNEVIPCNFDKVKLYTEDNLAVTENEPPLSYGRYFNNIIFNIKEQKKIAEYNTLSGMSEYDRPNEPIPFEGMIDMCIGEYLDVKSGNIIGKAASIEPNLTSPFYNGIAMLSLEDDFYFIDKKGEKVYAVEERNGKYGLVDKDGKEVVPCNYDYLLSYDSGYLKVENSDYGVGVYDMKNRREILKPEYAEIWSENLERKKIKLDNSDRILDDYDGSKTAFCHDGLFIVSKEQGQYGVFDSEGRQIIPYAQQECRVHVYPDYKLIQYSYSGFATENEIYYDYEGNVIADGQALECMPRTSSNCIEFNKGYFFCEYGKRKNVDDPYNFKILNTKGEKIFDITGKYSSFSYFNEGLFSLLCLDTDGSYKVLTLSGKEIKCSVKNISCCAEMAGGLMPIKDNLTGKYGYMNRAGKSTFDFKDNASVEADLKEINDRVADECDAAPVEDEDKAVPEYGREEAVTEDEFNEDVDIVTEPDDNLGPSF